MTVKRRILPFLASAGLFLVLAESIVALTDLDMKLLAPLLFYQPEDLAIHQASKNIQRHYEPRPGARALIRGRRISINSLGFRGAERPAKKRPGIFRIVCLGSSNTYGEEVSDDEAYPARMEEFLNREFPGRYEVWNAGDTAYALSQSVAWAEEIMARYEPDLLIFQVHRLSRRAFLAGASFSSYFKEDPALYLENLKFLPFQSNRLNVELMAHWRFLRALIFLANRFARIPRNNALYDSNALGRAAFRRFWLARSGTVPIVALFPLGPAFSPAYDGLALKTICLRDHLPRRPSADYLKIHPPAYVYRWYAKAIVSDLGRYGLLPTEAREIGASPAQEKRNTPLEMVQAYAQMRDYRKSLELLGPLLQRFPDKAALWLEQADLGLQSGDRNLAALSLAKASALGRSNDELLREAEIYLGLGEYRRVLALLKPMERAFSDDVRFWADQAEAAAMAGKSKLALRAVSRGRRLDPGISELMRMERVLVELGDYSGALSIRQRFIGRIPQVAALWIDAADLAVAAGENDVAARSLTRARSLNPGEEDVRRIAAAYRRIGPNQ